MDAFLPALPHGPLAEVFPDVFVVRGGFRIAPGLSITRNMTVVRQSGELVVLNSVRLTPEGEAALDRLGRVTHLVRLGAFHGADDPYYADRYRPTLWGPPGTKHKGGLTGGRELGPDACPVVGAEAFLFEKARRPEAALLIAREGGVLVTCDSYQHWTTFEGCSLLGRITMHVMGFGPTIVGGPWAREMGPAVRDDFERLLALPFRHLVPGHGSVLRDTAQEGLRAAVVRRYGR